jgi:hypothetical protein
VAEPVVHDYGNIERRDAVLADARVEPALDADGRVITRRDGKTTKPHPVTGEMVSDEAARVAQWACANPRKADWPAADFIVGESAGHWQQADAGCAGGWSCRGASARRDVLRRPDPLDNQLQTANFNTLPSHLQANRTADPLICGRRLA